MHNGRPWADFATEVFRQNQTKRDFIASTPTLEMLLENNAVGIANLESAIRNTETTAQVPAELRLRIGGEGSYQIRDLAHSQLAEFVGIPKLYYDRMRKEAPILLCQNLQHWLNTEQFKKTRLVRTLDGHVRAFLSNGYRPLDNLDLLLAIRPTLEEVQAEIISCEVTETRLYIKAVSHRITVQPRVGDIIEAGVMIQNSEVGCGRLSVMPFLHRLICRNGAVVNEYGIKQTHIGKRQTLQGDGEIPEEWLSTETKRTDDAAFFGKVRDVVRAYFNPDELAKIARKMKDATGREIGGDVPNVVTEVSKTHNLSEDESKAVLNLLIKGGDSTQYGLGNAITSLAGQVDDYDRATELERTGGKVFELGNTDWEALLKRASVN